MYQGDRPDLTDKMNLVAQRQRRTLGTLATDVVARSAYSAVGDLVTGHGSNDPQPVPVGAEGTVLTAAPAERGGVRWTPTAGGEVDSDENGNVWEGPGALAALTSGTNNTAVGLNALSSLTTGGSNTALGTQALELSTTDGGNVAVGYWALRNCNSGFQNTAVGYNVASNITTGWQNTAVGHSAGNITTGRSNTAVGFGALPNDPTLNYRTAIGYGTDVRANGGVAIGCDSSGAAAVVGALDTDVIVLGTANHKTRIPGIPMFTFGDKYLVVGAGGEIHVSALGPAS